MAGVETKEGSTYGALQPLKTLHECQLADKTWDVYVVVIPRDLAEQAVRAIKDGIPNVKTGGLAHLKRFVSADDLPPHVRARFSTAKTGSYPTQELAAVDETTGANRPGSSSGLQEYTKNPKKKQATKKSEQLFMVACPVADIPPETLAGLLSSDIPSLPPNPEIRSVTVPKWAPTSYDRSVAWSKSHWKTVYKQVNPFGPHPPKVMKAQEQIEVDVGEHMGLARRCADKVKEAGVGEAVGCVIVHRDWHGKGTVVVAAGDARYIYDEPGWGCEHECPEGNAMAHAAMRAIGMVARRRNESPIMAENAEPSICCAHCGKEDLIEYCHCDVCLEGTYDVCFECYNAGIRCWEFKGHDMVHRKSDKKPQKDKEVDTIPLKPPQQNTSDNMKDLFLDRPLADSPEPLPYSRASLGREGYLCHNLEMYLTHEPCVMCSMALVHSRFGRVAFERRMPRTGGLTAETSGEDKGLGHGLFWRKKLNWTMLAWEWKTTGSNVNPAIVGQDVHV